MQENLQDDDVKGYVGFHQKRLRGGKTFQTEEAADAESLHMHNRGTEQRWRCMLWSTLGKPAAGREGCTGWSGKKRCYRDLWSEGEQPYEWCREVEKCWAEGCL